MSFLDVLISRTSNAFKIFVYHKPTFSGVYSNFNGFISEEYKFALIFTLLFRKFPVVSDFSRFHSEVCRLREVIKKNAFPIKLIDSCIKHSFNKRLTENPFTLTAEKNNLVIVLLFLCNLSLDLRTGLNYSMNKIFLFCNIKVIFTPSTRISNFQVKTKSKLSYYLNSC